MEPAIGIKNTLLNLVNNCMSNYNTKFENEPLEVFLSYKKILFGLSWFHSISKER